ncbi:GNAT family N-acetyltransferase [Sulfitobacter sp. S190]|uniref:GNAT family N-acetyltransferase n=1 Tax=Sulfitobacter sp. S190 TaxID=2867022 RepID=UPI0021A451AD|nr:GNAT family N-acetyltransferase [Sulfitobacter sp. S190]UWR21659.1 GNAT family N-acetyltransferase [Sulfitobacter sp. S190]
MTPHQLAEIHAAAFTQSRAWSAAELADLLAGPYVQAWTAAQGFALTRTLAGESELLTLAVHPDARRRGIARGLLQDWLDTLEGNADTAFLDVAADNTAAIALYETLQFERAGLRRGYYARQGGRSVDALLMKRAITQG